METTKTGSNKIIVLALLVIGYIGFKKYLLSQSVTVFFKTFDLGNMQLLNPTINLVVQVNNPTSTSAEIQNIKGDLVIDGAYVGYVQGISPVKINSGVNIVKIPILLSYSGIADLYKKFNTGGFHLNFTGSMIVDYIPIPLNFDYNI